jgi:hypothetical protein
MPAISAVVIPRPGYVYVEGAFGDVPGATYACMERVDCLTGARFPLRPYVSYSTDGCLALSCGQAIWWDTEAPLDRCIRYCATVLNASGTVITQPADTLFFDNFNRVSVATWNTATSGQVWTTTGGAAADHSVNGTRGVHTTSVINTAYEDVVDVGSPNVRFYAEVTVPIVPTGASITTRHEFRRTDGANYYSAAVEWQTSGNVVLSLIKVVAGVQTFGSTTSIGTHAAGNSWAIVAQGWGDEIQLTGWKLTNPMPATPTQSLFDTSLTTGTFIGARTRRETGNTNGTQAITWDNITVSDVCADAVPIETCSSDLVVPSDGCFRLGDPVRPCNDQIVCLEGGNGCVPGEGIYFGSMGTEAYGDNSGQLLPVNARRPIVVSRSRRDVQSTLTLVTATFNDRDDVLALAEPGGELLWRGPADYGIPDRYMSVLDVNVDRGLSDHRVPPRIITMPHVAVEATVGPSQGVCGSRVQDLCDQFVTWDALIAAGLTYADLLRGKAGTPGSPNPNLATWNDVNADFANWTALNTNETSWNDTWQGFP